MREDWNRRACEDAGYYVAFGRRAQQEEEFFASGVELSQGLARELKRLRTPRPWRALEIGCGLGRLMRPLAAHFAEIHGVDVSDEMVRQAREKLREIPHARVHHTAGADLAAFARDSFEFIYSYAVFQHIPAREVVFSYLREARRVLKPGGVFRFQVNGLPATAARYDTWHGVRISAPEIAAFAREHDLQLLALEGVSTQYLWVTLRKPLEDWRPGPPAHRQARIRRITNAHSSEPVAPSRGRFASISLWLEGLPEDADLSRLEVRICGAAGQLSYLGPPEADGLQQLNVGLPEGLSSGLQPVEVSWLGQPIAPAATLRVIPPGPLVPRILSVTDGIDLLSGTRIVSRSVKVGLEEVADPRPFRAAIAGTEVRGLDFFCVDPLPPRYEINFTLPEAIGPGVHQLEMALGARRFAPVTIEVV